MANMVCCPRFERELIMNRPSLWFLSALAVALVFSFTPFPAAAQQSQPTAAKPKPPVALKTTKAPRTPWGDPDLQGFWATPSTVATPLERPEGAGNELSDEEQAAREE